MKLGNVSRGTKRKPKAAKPAQVPAAFEAALRQAQAESAAFQARAIELFEQNLKRSPPNPRRNLSPFAEAIVAILGGEELSVWTEASDRIGTSFGGHTIHGRLEALGAFPLGPIASAARRKVTLAHLLLPENPYWDVKFYSVKENVRELTEISAQLTEAGLAYYFEFLAAPVVSRPLTIPEAFYLK